MELTVDYEQFWDSVKTNLQIAKFRLLFVVDEIPRELKRIVEFLNEQMDPAEVLAVEIKQFVGEDEKTLVPRVLGLTSKAQQKKSVSVASRQWDLGYFLSELEQQTGREEVNLARDSLDSERLEDFRSSDSLL